MGIIEKQSVQDIANAIRNRNGLTTLYKPREMDEAILNLYSTTKVNSMLDYILPCYEKEATSYTIQYADADRPGSITKLEGNTTQQKLPDNYQEVEYIQSSGTQYIDTGVSPTSNTGFTIEYQESSTSGTKTLIGSGTSAAVGYIGISRNGTQLQAYWGKPNNVTSYTFTFDTKHKLKFNLNSDRKVVMDGTEIYTLATTPETTITTNTMTLFAFKYSSIVQYSNALKLYSCQIYNNGTLVRSYIPCYRKSDNIIGLYDLVTKAFFTNSGTGTFTKGNNVTDNTPKPNAPIDISTVSGDNEVVVSNEQHVTGNSYRVDLGGKNKLKIDDFTLGSNGLTYTCTNGIIRIQGTAGNLGYSTLELTSYVNINELNVIPNGTQLTFSVLGVTGIGAGQIFIGQTDNLYYWQPSASTKMVSNAKSAEITRVVIWFATTQGQTYDIYMNPQFEVGSVATEYSPHVSNPIELCKIGNYVDKLKRAEGKQLFNGEVELGSINTSGDVTTNNALRSTEYIKVEPSTQYTISNNLNYTTRIYEYNSSKTYVANSSQNTSTYTFTTSATTEYIRFRTIESSTQNNLDIKVMLNIGSTALPYEPYGNNWYIEKNIAKRVFTGDSSEVWSFATSGGYPRVTTNSITDGYRYNDTSRHIGKFLSSHFTPNTTDYTGHCYQYQASYLFNPTSDITSVATWRTWLGSNPMTLYYQLATPTYEIITNENLINQLNNIQDIELIENLCYVDWVGEEKPTMTLFCYLDKDKIIEEITG